MIYRHINIKYYIFIFMAGLHIISTAAGDVCNTDCILKSAANDQECKIEKTPLVRCEKFADFITADSILNSEYKNLRQRLSSEDASLLRDVQRNWIKWRDEKCEDAEEDADCQNGICLGVAHDMCILELTRSRASQLNNYKNDIKLARQRKFSF
jgi:uncharacterized protein YecT (DUF1311 family)